MNKWKCGVCGYVHQGENPPEKCPVCGADQSLFTPFIEEAGDSPKPTDGPSPAQAPFVKATQWRCSVCGYVHTGNEPPEKCPVCGADKTLFVPVTASAEARPLDSDPPHGAGTEAHQKQSGPGGPGIAAPWNGSERLSVIAQRLTQLHGHPIAVHIPNGLLPVTVLFGLIALLFGSASFAAAAKYNMVIVTLTMPIVIATGLIDWINRFGGRMTSIFRNKMICAGLVTIISIVLSIWWIVQPEIYTRGFFANGIFLLLHLIDLAAAALAGWFGGKLVFNK
jgi:rubredoxin/uncharacterized membrane protein